MGRGRAGGKSGASRPGRGRSAPASPKLAPGRGTAERREDAQVARSVRAVKPDGNGLVRLHQARDHAEKALGRPISDAAFKRAVFRLKEKGSHRVLRTSNYGDFTPRQLSRSIGGGTFDNPITHVHRSSRKNG